VSGSKTSRSAPRRVLGVVVATMALLLGLIVFQISRPRIVEDSSPLTIDTIHFNGLVTARVVGPPSDGRSPNDAYWPVVVVAIDYDRGPFYSGAAGELVEQPLPIVGDRFVVEVAGNLKLKTDATYAFYMRRRIISDTQEQEAEPWQSLLVLDGSDPYAPVAGTPSALVESLEIIRSDGESTKDAVIGFAQEFAAYAASVNAGNSVEMPSRLAALRAPRDEPSGVTAWMERVAQRPATGRQLPGDLADVAEIDGAGYMAAFGVDAWTPWRIVILLDDKLIGEKEWMALLVDDAGFFGPYGVTRGERILEIHGYGPTGGTLSIMTWPRGVPAEIAATGDLGIVEAKVEPLGELRLALGYGAAGDPDPAGISVIVDLRDGRSVVTQSDDKGITDLLSVEVAPTPPGSEMDQ